MHLKWLTPSFRKEKNERLPRLPLLLPSRAPSFQGRCCFRRNKFPRNPPPLAPSLPFFIPPSAVGDEGDAISSLPLNLFHLFCDPLLRTWSSGWRKSISFANNVVKCLFGSSFKGDTNRGHGRDVSQSMIWCALLWTSLWIFLFMKDMYPSWPHSRRHLLSTTEYTSLTTTTITYIQRHKRFILFCFVFG